MRRMRGVLLVLLGLWISSYGLRGLNYILGHIVNWGVLALLILLGSEEGNQELLFALLFLLM